MAKDAFETQLKVRNTCELIGNRIQELKNWTQEMKEQDELRKTMANGTPQVSAQHFFSSLSRPFCFFFLLPVHCLHVRLLFA